MRSRTSSAVTHAAPLPPASPASPALRARVDAAQDVAALAEAVVDWLEMQGVPLSSIFFEVAGRLRRVALRGYWQILEGFSIDDGIVAETFRSGEPQFVPDVSADPRYIPAIPDVVAELSLPIRHCGRVIGIMNIESPSPLTEQHLQASTTAAACFEERLAELGGPAPEKPWQRLARRSGELAGLEDPEDIGRFAIEAACEIFGFSSAMLVIERQGQLQVHAASGPLAKGLASLTPDELEMLASLTHSATSAYTLGEIHGQGFAGHRSLRAAGVRSMVSSALRSNGQRHGFLLVADTDVVAAPVELVQDLEILASHTASTLHTAFILQSLRERATQDPLTGLGHAGSFHELLAERLAAAHHRFAVLLLDLDHFNQVNDTLGHLVGDRVIVETADLLRKAVRNRDELFRIGGDEFAIIADVQDAQDALAIAERASTAAMEGGRTPLSCGVVVVDPGELTDSDTVFGCAELALKAAKRGGRNRAVLYRSELQEAARADAKLQAEILPAISNGEFFLEYQPVMSLRSPRAIGLESLIRWRHPEHGLIPPTRFIPLAERGDLIGEISRFVVDEACRSYARWREHGWLPPGLWVSVNASAGELGGDFARMLLDTLERYEVPPNRFVVEVTEDTLVDEHNAVVPLRGLRERGINVAVDDFGTGYSSLSYLHRLPVNVLKIDRSFIAGFDDPTTRAVTRSIIELAHTLGLTVIAEGVEHAEQADILRSLGCRAAQGFLWSRPVGDHQLRNVIAQL